MQIGMIGFGRMGSNIERLTKPAFAKAPDSSLSGTQLGTVGRGETDSRFGKSGDAAAWWRHGSSI